MLPSDTLRLWSVYYKPSALPVSGVRRGADVRIIFVVALISISLCSCALHSDANIQRNQVGLTVLGNDQNAILSHVRNEKDGPRLATNTASNSAKLRGSTEWMAHGQSLIANPNLYEPLTSGHLMAAITLWQRIAQTRFGAGRQETTI
jgi:hypothetical protein